MPSPNVKKQRGSQPIRGAANYYPLISGTVDRVAWSIHFENILILLHITPDFYGKSHPLVRGRSEKGVLQGIYENLYKILTFLYSLQNAKKPRFPVAGKTITARETRLYTPLVRALYCLFCFCKFYENAENRSSHVV